MQASRLLASTSFRLSAIYAALLVLTFLSAAGGAWLATRTAAMNEAGDRLERAYVSIADRVEFDDAESALRAIERHGRRGGMLWRLDGPDGVVVAGDPTLPSRTLGFHMIDLPEEDGVDRPDGPTDLRGDHAVLVRDLPDGGRITLALDIQASEISRDAVLSALLWAGAASVLIALAAGVFATRRALSRMDTLSAAARAFGAGDLSTRVPQRAGPAPDDVDQLIVSFNQMFDRIDRLVSDVRRVSADVAHELGTPLTHVRQKLEAGARATSLEDAHVAFDAAQGDLDVLHRTFETMLRLSEIGAGGLRASFKTVDLAHVAETVCDAYRPDLEASGRVLETAIEKGTLALGDAHLLAQAAANLLENAMRHTPSGARIVVAVSASGGASGGAPTLSVEDDGPGVPAAERERVLEPFVRLEGSRTSPGSGLGLSIVAAVARLHGAALELEDARPGLRVTLAFQKGER